MASVRRWGAIRGAGVQVAEKSPGEPITPATTGVIAVLGKFERGLVSTGAAPQFNLCTGKEEFRQRMGGRLGGTDYAPEVCQDFWDLGAGAGAIVAVRLTDGTEKTASLKLYDRRWGAGFYAPIAQKDSQSQIKQPVATITAHNAGRWAGGTRKFRGAVAAGGDFGVATVTDATATWVVNEWAGASLVVDEVAKTYKVLSNTATVLTVETGNDIAADRVAAGASSLFFAVEQASAADYSLDKSLRVQVGPPEADITGFSLKVYLNDELMATFPSLSMDPTSRYYAPTQINVSSNIWIRFTDTNADVATQADVRPAGFYGQARALSATKAEFNTAWIRSVSDANIKVVDLRGYGKALAAGRYTFTWVLASNHYTVAHVPYSRAGVQLQDLPAFAVGAAAQYHKTYSQTLVPTLIVDHKAAIANLATIVIDCQPLEETFVQRGGYVLPKADTDPRLSYRVGSATQYDVTIEGGSLLTAGGIANAAASVTGTAAGPHTVVVATDDTVKMNVDGRTTVTVTLTPGVGILTTVIAAEINAAFDAVFGVGNLNPASVYVDALGATYLRLTGGTMDGGGKSSTITIEAVAHDAYTVLGLTAATTYGAEGTEFEVQWPQALSDGFDGGTPADADYTAALAVGNGPLKALEEEGLGFIKVVMPGKETTAVQKMLHATCEALNYGCHTSVPAATVLEADVLVYINSTIGRNDFSAVYWPSWVYVQDPDKPELERLIPNCGMVLGRDAKYARDLGHYIRPAAGLDATLPRITRLPTTGTNGKDRTLNHEILNPAGVNILRRKKGNYVVWGGRAIAKSTNWNFFTQRAQMSHYEWTMRDSMDWTIFETNDSKLWKQLLSVLKVFFAAEWAKGAIRGDTLDEAVIIKVDDENNTDATISAGDLNVEIAPKLGNYVERAIFTMNKQGIFESA